MNKFNPILMRANPDYFKLSQDEQERYRLDFFNHESEEEKEKDFEGETLSEKHYRYFDCFAAKQIFNEPLLDDDKLEGKSLYEYNKLRNEFVGFGNDKITLSEFFMSYNNLLDIPTLFDYDYAFEKDQIKLEIEECERTKRDPSKFINKEYKFRLNSIWIRFILNDELFYGSIYSSFFHIHQKLQETISNEVKSYYPHEMIDVEENDESFLGQFGIAVDAKGKEKFLEELERRTYQNCNKIAEEAYNEVLELNLDGVIIEEHEDEDGKHINFIVLNESTAKKITWQDFYKDMKNNEVNIDVLDEIIKKYLNKFKDCIKSDFEDIESNFDPDKVAPIRKMKFIFTDKAKEDIIKLAEKDIKDDSDDIK